MRSQGECVQQWILAAHWKDLDRTEPNYNKLMPDLASRFWSAAVKFLKVLQVILPSDQVKNL